MSREARAAQFSPFAALVGYEASISEASRLTDEQQVLDDDCLAELNRQMNSLRDRINERPLVTVVYFIPDLRKSGGRYATATAPLVKIDDIQLSLTLEGEEPIPLANIVEIRV